MEQRALLELARGRHWGDAVLRHACVVFQGALCQTENFVLQLCVVLCSSEQLDRFCGGLEGRAARVARNRFGCRVMCRIVERSAFSPAARGLVAELQVVARELARHRYGNFVVQTLLASRALADATGLVEACLCDPSHFGGLVIIKAAELDALAPGGHSGRPLAQACAGGGCVAGSLCWIVPTQELEQFYAGSYLLGLPARCFDGRHYTVELVQERTVRRAQRPAQRELCLSPFLKLVAGPPSQLLLATKEGAASVEHDFGTNHLFALPGLTIARDGGVDVAITVSVRSGPCGDEQG
jgi:hypothetical protein